MKTNLLYYCLVLCVPIFGSFSYLSQKPFTVHYFVMANSNDIRIGDECDKDAQKMLNEIPQMKYADHVTVEEYDLSGPKFNLATFKSSLQNADIKKNDVLYFYISTNGACPVGDDSIPYDKYNRKLQGNGNEFFYLNDIKDLLDAKKVRLQIVIADVCSAFLKERPDTKKGGKNSYEVLLSSRGKVLAISSECGGFAYSSPSNGAIFTEQYLKAINHYSKRPEVLTWDILLAYSRNKTIQIAKRKGFNQCPTYRVK